MFHKVIHLIFVCDLIHLSVYVFLQVYLDVNVQVFLTTRYFVRLFINSFVDILFGDLISKHLVMVFNSLLYNN